MSFFPGLIFVLLVVGFVASAVWLYRSIRRRRYGGAFLLSIVVAVLAFYFLHVAFGPFFQKSPDKIFEYALGFLPPAGCTNVVGYEEQGFSPGAKICLRFRASPQAVAELVSQAHFSVATSETFSRLQQNAPELKWWTPPSEAASFWQSDDFHGPYAFHTAVLAYEHKSETAFLYVSAFE